MDRQYTGPVSGNSVVNPHRGLALPLKMLCDRTRQFLGERGARVFDQINESFFDLADSSSDAGLQTAYFDAIKRLRADKAVIIEQWSAGVASAFDSLPAMAIPCDEEYGNASGFTRLPGDDDLEEVVAFDEIVSAANACNRCELLVLQRRVSKVLDCNISLSQLPLGPEFITEQFVEALRTKNLTLQPRLSLLDIYNEVVLGQLPDLFMQSNQLLEDLGILPDLMPDIETLEVAESEEGKLAEPGPLAIGKNQAIDRICAITGAAVSERESGLRGVVRCPDNDSRNSHRLARVRGNNTKAIVHSVQAGSASDDLTTTGTEREKDRRGARERRINHKDLPILLQHRLMMTDLVENDFDSAAYNAGSGPPRREERGIQDQITIALNEQEHCFVDLSDHDRDIIILLDQWFCSIRKGFDDKSQEGGKLSVLFSRIELPVCRAVLSDPSFFDFAQHPLRRLLNEVFKVGDWLVGVEELSKDPLYKKLDQLFKSIPSVDDGGGIDSVFWGDLLSELIRFIEADQQRIRVAEKRLLKQTRAAAKIDSVRFGVDELLTSRLVGKEFGYALVEFAEKAWANVLFRTSLKYGVESEQWFRAVHLLDQLLGFELHDEIDEGLLDRLVHVLSESLTDIAFDSYEVQRMLSNIRQYLLKDKNKAENTQPVIFDKTEAQQINDYCLRIKVESVDPSIPGENNSAEKELTGRVDDNLLMEVDSLKEGAWVELQDDNAEKSRRCRFIGSVGSVGKYLFGDRNACQIAVFSRNHLALKLKSGALTMLDNAHVFDDLLIAAAGETDPVDSSQ